MLDQQPIEGCGQMAIDEGLLAHAVDGGVALHQDDGGVFVANQYLTPGRAADSELELSLHNNVLAVAGLRDDKIRVFSNGTGENAINWTEVLELDLFNAGLFYDSFDVFGGFLAVVEGHDLFTFDYPAARQHLPWSPTRKKLQRTLLSAILSIFGVWARTGQLQ